MTEQPFIDYVIAAEHLLEHHYGLTLNDAGIELDELAAAQEEGSTPAEFVDWFARKYDLDPLNPWRPRWP
jgi:hypothetical protein